MMRQAGRYMKEYQELRISILRFAIVLKTELAIEISCNLSRLQPDGVILFSDILTPLPGVGFL